MIDRMHAKYPAPFIFSKIKMRDKLPHKITKHFIYAVR